MPEPGSRPVRPREAGFVLLLVISAIGLLALVAAGFAHMARTQVKTAASASESARAEALADAGVHLAVLDLLQAQAEQNHPRRYALDGTPVSCAMSGDGELAISVQDEGGKVDLNSAGEALISALAAGIGFGDPRAVADAIIDYRDADSEKRPAGAEREEYRSAGRPQGPKNGPFVALEELQQVLGLTADDAVRLGRHATLYSGQNSIDPDAASPELLRALADGHAQAGFLHSGGTGGTTLTRAGPLPSNFLQPSARRYFAVRAEARSPAGAAFVREAIVELGRERGVQSYSFRRWRRGVLTYATSGRGEALPPC